MSCWSRVCVPAGSTTRDRVKMTLGLTSEELTLRKSKQRKERYEKNRESVRAARDAVEAANPELREERQRKKAEADKTSQLKSKAAEAANPELREERQRKKAESNETSQLKRKADEAENPELREERLRKQAAAYETRKAAEAENPELRVARLEKAKQKYDLENGKAKSSKYYNINKERITVYQREYNAAHRKEANARGTNRMKTDSAFATAARLRVRLNHCLKGKGIKKTEKTLDLLGCTASEAVKYLETNTRGLKLEGNHIDHIRPLSSFNNLHLPSERRMANHYLNLQILTPEENLRKGADFDYATWSVTELGSKLIELERGWKKLLDP